MKAKISVLIPEYNECDNLLPLIQEVTQVLKGIGNPYEIIVVDDGSTDGSDVVLRNICDKFPNVKAIFFRTNTGQTAALDAALRSCTGDYVVTMDADRQNDPADIPGMLAKLEEGYDCVAGRRANRKDGLFLRKIPSRIANGMIRRLYKSKLHDLGCSLKIFRIEFARDLSLYGEMHRFFGLLLEAAGARMYEYNVGHRPRVAGVSKYNLTRTFKVLLDLVTISFFKSYRTKPIHVFGIGGGIFWFAGSLLIALTLYDKMALSVPVHRNPLFTIAIFLFAAGLQFVVFGLLAELLIRIYFETGEKRPYSIGSTLGFEPTAIKARPVVKLVSKAKPRARISA